MLWNRWWQKEAAIFHGAIMRKGRSRCSAARYNFYVFQWVGFKSPLLVTLTRLYQWGRRLSASIWGLPWWAAALNRVRETGSTTKPYHVIHSLVFERTNLCSGQWRVEPETEHDRIKLNE